MTGIDTTRAYELEELMNPSKQQARKVTSSMDGRSKVLAEGDTRIFEESNEMGKDAFLNLLVTQLRYQDPLNPTEDTEFVSQLAQFTSLENSQTMVESMTGLAENMNEFMTLQTLNSQSAINSQSIGLLGKKVRVSAPEINYAGSPVEINIQTHDKRSSLMVVIKDSEGEVVFNEKIDTEGNLNTSYTWQGLTKENLSANNGQYTVEIMDEYQNRSVGSVYVEGKVEAIKYTDNGANVQIDGQNYLPRYILNVLEV
ncbi:MAG: hypothetical protein GX801_00060 [Fibrobacter sp.]|nr:hypothetical protein [Fibrobacter sp.]